MSDNHYYYGAPSPYAGMPQTCCVAPANAGSTFTNEIAGLTPLILVAGLFGGFNGNGGGLFGGGGNNTAASTAALVEQNRINSVVSTIGADTREILGQTGGLITAVNTVGNRTQDGFAGVRQDMCQQAYNTAQQFNAVNLQGINNYNGLTSQITDLRFQNAQCCCDTKANFAETNRLMADGFCRTNRNIDDTRAEIKSEMASYYLKSVEQERDDLKVRLATQEAACSRAADKSEILAAIAQMSCQPKCCPQTCGCGNSYGNGCSIDYQRAMLGTLTSIDQGIQQLSAIQGNQGTQISAILARVNQIPTTTA